MFSSVLALLSYLNYIRLLLKLITFSKENIFTLIALN